MGAAEHAAFRADVEERGITTPLDVTAAGVVLDGRQRLRAARELGIEHVPIRIVAPADERDYMLRAAVLRRQLTPSQKAALIVEFDGFERRRAEALERRLANLKQYAEVETLPPRGKTHEKAARFGRVSARTLQDAALVREADPELFAAIKAGAVPAHRAAKRIRRARRLAEIEPAAPLPAGPFDVVLADPPWRSQSPGSDWSPEQHYPTLTTAEIAALEVPAGEDALLLLWAVNCSLPDALRVMEAWGFDYRTNLVWVKDSIGLGFWARNRHELLLVGRRGNFPLPDEADRPDSVIEAPRGRHSEKPACMYELVERMYPQAAKLELFARAWRPGWTAWGNELPHD